MTRHTSLPKSKVRMLSVTLYSRYRNVAPVDAVRAIPLTGRPVENRQRQNWRSNILCENHLGKRSISWKVGKADS